MKTSMRLLGATLGATAVVGASAVAANACDTGGHDGPQSSFSSSGTSGGDSTQDWGYDAGAGWAHNSDQGSDENADQGSDQGTDQGWSHGWGHHRHDHSGVGSSTDQAGTFEQKQAAIVERLTSADTRLSDLISQVQGDASSDPGATQELGQLQEHQAKLESLIDAVKAATNEDELKAAFENAVTGDSAPDQSGGDTTTAPSTTPLAVPVA